MNELQEIKNYEEKIKFLESEIEELGDDVFDNMHRAECKRNIKEFASRIKRLEARIANETQSDITDEQIAIADYVLSDAYDND